MSSQSSPSLMDIPPVFPFDFPPNYINNVAGWGIPSDLLHTRMENGILKLLTLDIDFGDQCSLACPHCFRKSKALKTDSPPLTFYEWLGILSEAKKLGLQSVKILGAGEPFENPQFIDFLYKTCELGIQVAIFTKGHVLGSDYLTQKYFGHRGIKTGYQLIQILNEMNVSILLGFNSFQKDVQESFIGFKRVKKWDTKEDYLTLRNTALLSLIEAGFNAYLPDQATRLALIAAPIKPENIHEIFDIYTWGRVRHIYVASCPTTYSGLGKRELKKERRENIFDNYIEDLKRLYVKIYVWNLEKKLMTLSQLEVEGISLYPGAHPCNQVAAGMYVTLRGKVIRCPGKDDRIFTICDDIQNRSLVDVWLKSANYKLATQDRFNFNCIARDGVFFKKHHNFYRDIMKTVLERFAGENKNELK